MHTSRVSLRGTAPIVMAALLVALTACAPQPAPPAAPTPSAEQPATEDAPDPLGPREPTLNLAAPWSVAYVGNSAIVSGRDSGKLHELTEQGEARELLTVPGVVHGGEGGLLGLTASPAKAGDQPTHLYAYSTAEGGNRVQRFPITGAPGALSVGPPETIIDGLPNAHSHNGGRIAFGPDRMLYVTVGDAGQPALAQDLASLAGKILRVTPDGKVPADNPFEDSPVFTFGHRNPQGIAWGPDGTMYSAELGQDAWDELNVIAAGKNYGWPVVEGIGGDDRYVDPVQQWAPAEASPSGMAIVNDTIYIANLRGQRVRSIPLSDLSVNTEHFAGEYGRIRDVSVSPDGRLWLLTNNTDGRVDPRPDDDRFIDTGLVE